MIGMLSFSAGCQSVTPYRSAIAFDPVHSQEPYPITTSAAYAQPSFPNATTAYASGEALAGIVQQPLVPAPDSILIEEQSSINDEFVHFFEPWDKPTDWKRFNISFFAGNFSGFRYGLDFGDGAAGLEVKAGSRFRNRTLNPGTIFQFDLLESEYIADLDLLIYPRLAASEHPYHSPTLRPYGLIGIGGHKSSFDSLGTNVPIGGGVKWAINKWAALRVDVRDNLTFGPLWRGDLHNFELSGGLDLRLF